jgi:hypothetical protein
VSGGDFGVAVTSVDREEPGATIVVAGSSPASVSTFTYDVNGSFDARGIDLAGSTPADPPVLVGAVDPIPGGNGVFVIGDDATHALQLYDARTGSQGPVLRETIDSCGGPLAGLGGPVAFGVTDPDLDRSSLVGLAGDTLFSIAALDLGATPECVSCTLPGRADAITTAPVGGGGDADDVLVLFAATDLDPGSLWVFGPGQIEAGGGGACPAPLLQLPPPAGERFGSAIDIGDLDDDERPEIAIRSHEYDEVYVLWNLDVAEPPDVAMIQPAVSSSSFGETLAFGDMDHDGDDEVIVGAPTSATSDEVPGAGQVTVYNYTVADGFTPEAILYDSTPVADQAFGRSLAVAEFGLGSGAFADLLVVGARDEVFTYFRVIRDENDVRQ